MKFATIALLLASIVLNAAFLTGCVTPATFGRNVAPVRGDGGASGDGGKARLAHIAGMLDLPTEGRTAFDLENDIRRALSREVAVPAAYDAAAFEKMAGALSTEQEAAMREYQRFISKLQGKRVIAVGGDE